MPPNDREAAGAGAAVPACGNVRTQAPRDVQARRFVPSRCHCAVLDAPVWSTPWGRLLVRAAAFGERVNPGAGFEDQGTSVTVVAGRGPRGDSGTPPRDCGWREGHGPASGHAGKRPDGRVEAATPCRASDGNDAVSRTADRAGCGKVELPAADRSEQEQPTRSRNASPDGPAYRMSAPHWPGASSASRCRTWSPISHSISNCTGVRWSMSTLRTSATWSGAAVSISSRP